MAATAVNDFFTSINGRPVIFDVSLNDTGECPTNSIEDTDVLFITSRAERRFYKFDAINLVEQALEGDFGYSTDLAHTPNKLFMYSPLSSVIIKEFDLQKNPFLLTFNKDISNVKFSAGLHAISDTKLILLQYNVSTRRLDIYESDIVGSAFVNTLKFSSIMGRVVSGDYFLTTTGKFIVTTVKSGAETSNRSYISQYDYSTGALEFDFELTKEISTLSTPWGIFEEGNKIYIADGLGDIFEINSQAPYEIVNVYTLPSFEIEEVIYIDSIQGASQISSRLNTHFQNNASNLPFEVWVAHQNNTLGSTNGSIDVFVNGGVEPYTYLWADGPTTQNRTGLSGGEYSVTVTDSAFHSKTLYIQVTNHSNISITSSKTNDNAGTNAGQITINTVSNGYPPYTYLWNNGDTTNAISGLGEGTYVCKITDNKGYKRLFSFKITKTVPSILSIEGYVLSHQPYSNINPQNPQISLLVKGGAQIYNVQRNGVTHGSFNDFSSNIFGAFAGTTSTYLVTDNLGNTASIDVIVDPYPPQFFITGTKTDDTGGGNGTINIILNNGVGPFTFRWDDSLITTQNRTGLSPGRYKCIAMDSIFNISSKDIVIR